MESLERRQMLAITVDSFLDNFDPLNPTTDGVITLREAIYAADTDSAAGDAPAGSGTDEINFDATLSDATITLDRAKGEISFESSITINAGNLTSLTIDADDPNGFPNDGNGIRIFNIIDPSNGVSPPAVELVGLTLTGADPDFNAGETQGGAIRSEAILIVRDSIIVENGADFGAGIYLEVAGNGSGPRTVLTIENSQIERNSAFRDGGGVFVRFDSPSGGQDTVLIDGSSLSHNVAGPRDSTGEGGALYITTDFGSNANHSVVISSSVLDTNSADKGGAIYHRGNAQVDLSILESSVVSGNTATGFHGGGVYSRAYSGSRLQIADSTISGNTSARSGGGLYARLFDASSLVIEDSEISGNTAGNDGGGVFAQVNPETSNPFPTPRAITVSRSLISGNTASDRGGGLYTRNFDGTETLVEDSQITGNHALGPGSHRNGGGIYAYLWGDSQTGINKPRFTISGSTVDNNDADHEGGGIFVCSKFFGEFVAVNSTISDNRTLNGRGGGIFIARFGSASAINESIDAFLNNLTVTQNVSQSGGGVELADLDNVRVQINNSIISENYDDGTKTTQSNLVGRVDIANTQYNLVGDGSSVLDLSGVSTSLDSTNILNNSPQLSALAFHGGLTPTHRLASTSPAVDAGSNALAENPLTSTPLSTDQRGAGFQRIFDLSGIGNNGNNFTVDIGAYEIGLPKVINVIISGSISLHDPYSFDTATYDDPSTEVIETDPIIGSGKQIRTVPVGGADTISIVFSEGVTNVSDTSLKVTGLTTATVPMMEDFSNISANQASWRFSGWALGDNYLLSLSDSVTGVDGNMLDGEWTNPKSINTLDSSGVSKFPSGDGTPGENFNFLITLLPGDANLDGIVDVTDLGILATNWEMAVDNFFDADFNGDGFVDVTDLGLLATNWQTNLSTLNVYADPDGKFIVDETYRTLIQSNYGMDPEFADGDVNGDGVINVVDYDLAFELLGLEFDWVA